MANINNMIGVFTATTPSSTIISTGSTNLYTLFASFRTIEEETKYQEEQRVERERRKWISENVYTREILFEKIKKLPLFFTVSGCTNFYSGSTNLSQLLNHDLISGSTIGISSRGIGVAPIHINSHSEFAEIFGKQDNV